MLDNISVIIPVYNQSISLSLTLYGFVNQIKPFNKCKIIVVDDGSTESIKPIVDSYRNLLNINYCSIEKSGRAASRNMGVQYVRDGLIIFNDADRIPRKDFVKKHYESYLNSNYKITIGQVREMYVSDIKNNKHKVLNYYHNEKNDRVPQYCNLVYNLFDNSGTSVTKIPWISTLSGNMSIPYSLFKQLGGFDTNFKEWGFEHFEFGFRAHQNNIPFYYEKDAINVHLAHPRSSSSYEENIIQSHSYFYQKHNLEIIRYFSDFMLGKITLQEYAKILDPRYPIHNQLPKRYVKITNN